MELAIAKYKNHPGMDAITKKMEKLGNPTFDVDFFSYKETVKRPTS